MEYTLRTPSGEYRFPLSEGGKIQNTLSERGWVVVSSVASTQEVSELIELEWDYLESLGTGLKRDQVETWYQPWRWPHLISIGQVNSPYIGQSDPAWRARTLPSVKRVFQTVYQCSELLTSFDALNIARPYTLAKNRTRPFGPHLDQDPRTNPEFECYQGLLALTNSNLEDGGTMLLDRSHLDFKQRKGTQFSQEKDLYQRMLCPTLENGDMLLWDSRVIHGVSPPRKGSKDPKGSCYFRRNVIYISMVPKERVSLSVRKRRREAFQRGETSSHRVVEYIKKRLRTRYPRKIPYQNQYHPSPYAEDELID